MKRSHDHLGIKVLLAAGVVACSVAAVATASPRYGGECHYCHTNQQENALKIEGFKTIQDDLKVFEVTPGGSVDLTFNVDNPGDPEYYRLVVRGLDHLNGESNEEGMAFYLPRLYTPDPDWATKGGTTQSQYLFREGQFYEVGPEDEAMSFVYNLTVGPEVELGLYELSVNVGGGSPETTQLGQMATGGWFYDEEFLLRVVPEPGSAMLLLMGVVMLGSLRKRGRKSVAMLAIVSMVGLMTTNAAHAFPSRSGNCAVCHNIQGPSDATGDFEIKDVEGNATDAFTAAPGDEVTLRFDYTQLVEDSQNPGTFRRGYMILDKLDLLNVGPDQPPVTDEIATTPRKYTPTNVGEEDGQWHDASRRVGVEWYIGPFGQYYAQDSTDPAESMLFPLTLGTDVEPGTYHLAATLSGGRVTDELYLNGWYVTKNFTLTVTPPGLDATVTIPEPSSLILLGLAVPMLLRRARRKR